MGGCAGGAVLKKIAARFSFRGLRARKDTIAHATESHGVIRATVAVARRTAQPAARPRRCGDELVRRGGFQHNRKLRDGGSWDPKAVTEVCEYAKKGVPLSAAA